MQKCTSIMLSLVLALAGCNLLGAQPEEHIDTLEEAREHWTNQRIESYSIYQEGCCGPYLPGAVYARVVARKGKVDTLVETDEDIIETRAHYEDAFEAAKTIEEIFALIEREQSEGPDSLSVKYNQEYGYPSSLYVDPSYRIAHEEYGIEMSNLKVISRKR